MGYNTYPQEYGVFLCPSRMDTRGVSRYKEMTPGLLPITYTMAAIPEFDKSSDGYMDQKENYSELVDALEAVTLYDKELKARSKSYLITTLAKPYLTVYKSSYLIDLQGDPPWRATKYSFRKVSV
ncbi:hypothetical protein [Microbulbifer spongiae]|uniref:Solute-binding protein family 5 domain-containing protein n=1 Tax=Microbulbifer spongiae TaxID=2944933 RepID=A0ABY9EG78_9GAMM|nr:hypothetical protein [Microbulbifer sp. MI-G]WKD51446.1 hypothetical protein M8T91_08505 [Microbulbifer sp. MI-G]